MPKTRSQLRAAAAKTVSSSFTGKTSKYFSSGTDVTKKDEPNKSSSSKTVARKTTRKHIIIETEESSTDINSSEELVDKSEKRLDKEPSKPPIGWEAVYKAIKEYRKNIIAPVDTMGCERLADEPSDNITPQTSRFQTLVSLMLSSQTKDHITAAAVQKLRQNLSGGLSLDSVLQAEERFLDECISQVGFHRKKAVYLKQAAKICKEKYDNDIPNTVEGLMKLPGVGPKMAYLCMQVAWKQNEGIGVDVHVHRITNRLGWCKTGKYPEATRKSLESWLPRSLWQEINPMLVGFGQTTCSPQNPKCSSCPVNHICPSVSL